MDTTSFNNLLLKTAFSCMACDGDIDKREVQLIKKMHDDEQTFGDVTIGDELSNLVADINQKGQNFLRDYLDELKAAELSESDELKIVEVAISTIKADQKVEYSEIKFFKVLRSMLQIDDQKILDKHSDFEEYLEKDIISDSYLAGLQADYFTTLLLPQFENIIELDSDIIDEEN